MKGEKRRGSENLCVSVIFNLLSGHLVGNKVFNMRSKLTSHLEFSCLSLKIRSSKHEYGLTLTIIYSS